MMPKLQIKLQIMCAAFFTALSCHAAWAENTRTLEYSWLTDERITGQQTVIYSNDGTSLAVHFEYADRGRGPDFDSQIDLDRKGLPVRFEATGVNNTRAKINELFSNDNGVASWISAVEQGSRKVSDKVFYLPVNSSPEVKGLLARALLNDADQRIGLLPDGEASIEEVASTTLKNEDQTKAVTLYRLRGVDTDPTYLWLDERGDLVSFSQKHFAMMPRGWEQTLSTLKELEGAAKSDYYEQLAKAHTQNLSGLTAIAGARVFDSITGELSQPATVFLWDGMISAVYTGNTTIPDEARVINGQGHTLLPALWDMHNHVSAPFLANYLAFGITNVRDMGNNHKDLQALMGSVRDGSIAGPDIYPMGFIDQRGEFAAPVGRLAADLDEALAHVDFFARRGYRGIKIYSAIEPDWIAPMAAAARQRGLPVAGHIPAFVSARDAIEAGFNEITHVNQLLLAFLGGGELDTRGPERFLVPGIQTADLDIDSEEVNDFLAFMRDREIAHDTTLAVIVELFRNRPGEVSPIFAAVNDHLPVPMRRAVVMTNGYNQGQEESFSRSSNVMLKLMAKLHQAGIPLLPGTDNILPGMTLVRELIYYAEAGIPVPEVLQLGTIVPARHMGVEQRIGSIEVGKEAHMFLVAGNPLEDINALYRVAQVFKGSKMYYAPDLLRTQGVRPFLDSPQASP